MTVPLIGEVSYIADGQINTLIFRAFDKRREAVMVFAYIDKLPVVAFEIEKQKHVSITIHSSKGLEFNQVIIFAEDYDLTNDDQRNNHYVAVTRAKEKLIIVKRDNANAENFEVSLKDIFLQNSLRLNDLVKVIDVENQ